MCSDFFALVLTRRPELKDLLLKPVALIYNDPRVSLPAAKTFAEPAAPIPSRGAPKQVTAPRLLSIKARIEGVPYIPLESLTKPYRPTGIPAAKVTSASPALQQNIQTELIAAVQQISDNEVAEPASQLPSSGAAADGYSSDAETADEQTADITEELRIRSEPDYISSLATLTFRDIKICQERFPSRRGTYDGVLSLSQFPYALNSGGGSLTLNGPRHASTPGSPHAMPLGSPNGIPLGSACRVRCSSGPCGINISGGGGGSIAAIDVGPGASSLGERYHFGRYDLAQSHTNRPSLESSPSLRNLAAVWDRRPLLGDMPGLLHLKGVPVSSVIAPAQISKSRGSSCAGSSRDPNPHADMRHHRRRPGSLDGPGSAHVSVPRQLTRTSSHDPVVSGSDGEGVRGETDNGWEALERSEALARRAGMAGSSGSQSSIDSQLISRLLQERCHGLEAFLPSGGRSKLVARRLRQLRSQLLRSPADIGTRLDAETELDVAAQAEGDAEVDVNEEVEAGADILEPRQVCANVLLRMESSPARMMLQRPLLRADASGHREVDGGSDGNGDGEGEGSGGRGGGAGCNDDADDDCEGALATSRPREARARLRVAMTSTPRLYTPAVLDLQLQLQQQLQQQQTAYGRVSQVSWPTRAQSPVLKPTHGQVGGVAATDGDASGGDACDGVGAGGAVATGAVGNGAGSGSGSVAHVGRQTMQLPVRQPQPPLLPYGGILRLAVANGNNGLPFALVHPRASWQSHQHGRSPKRISGRRAGSGGGSPSAASAVASNNHRGSAVFQSLGGGFNIGDQKPVDRCASPPPGAASLAVAAAGSPLTALLRSSDTGSALRPDLQPYGRLSISASDGDSIAGCVSPLADASLVDSLTAASLAATAAMAVGTDGHVATLRPGGVHSNSRPAPAMPPPPPLLPSLKGLQQKGPRAPAYNTNRHRRSGGDVPPLTPTGQTGKYEQRTSFTGSSGGGVGGFAGDGVGGGGLGGGRIAVGNAVDLASNASASGAAATATVAVVLAVADGSATAAEYRQYRQYKLGFTTAITAPAVSSAMRYSSTEVNQGRPNSLLPVINQQQQPAGRNVSKLHPSAAVPFPNFAVSQSRAPE